MNRYRALGIAASVFGLAGMYLGSTERYGVLCYVVGSPCLIACVCHKKMWELLPMNLAQAAIIAINVWRAWG